MPTYYREYPGDRGLPYADTPRVSLHPITPEQADRYAARAAEWRARTLANFPLSGPLVRALRAAASRKRGNVRPIHDTQGRLAAAATLRALDQCGFIDWVGGASGRGTPRINAAGRARIQFETDNFGGMK